MTALPRLLFVALALLATTAQGQWAWIDAQGQRVYSDRPPPPDIPLRNVLRQPTPRAEAPNPAAPPAAPAAAAPTPAAPASAAGSGRDPTLEARKREQEQAEAAKRKAEEARVKEEQARAAATRAENCTRVRQSLAVLQSGQRMRVPLPNGEMGFMTDEQRDAENARLQQMLVTECAP